MLKRLLNVLMAIAAGLIVLITLAICYGVALRKGFGGADTWVNDATSFSLLAITFLGGGLVAYRDGHTRVDLITSRLDPATRVRVEAVSHTICFLASAVLAAVACYVMVDNYSRGTLILRSLVFPKWLAILPVFVGALLTALVYADKIVKGRRQPSRLGGFHE